MTVCDSRDGYFDTAPLSKIPSQPSRTVTHSLYCLSRALVSDPHGHAHSERESHDLLVLRYGRERLDETLELMLEVILSKRPYIRIAGDDFPREIVKSRFLKINSGHLEYVFDCIDKNATKVGNIKAYLLAALYNAPATMDSYYRAEVNHDLYGC